MYLYTGICSDKMMACTAGLQWCTCEQPHISVLTHDCQPHAHILISEHLPWIWKRSEQTWSGWEWNESKQVTWAIDDFNGTLQYTQTQLLYTWLSLTASSSAHIYTLRQRQVCTSSYTYMNPPVLTNVFACVLVTIYSRHVIAFTLMQDHMMETCTTREYCAHYKPTPIQ